MITDFLGKLVADKYRIESLLLESESGDLYAGRHEVLDKPVTVKILSPALAVDARWVRRFVDNARTASAVSDPNILNITDFGTDAKGISYAVYEPLEGSSLADFIAGAPAMDESRALPIARQIGTALAAAHGKDVIHGALAPRSVQVITDEAGSERIKVYGFGGDRMKVARDADPRYLAPEQCSAFPAADARSDIYALGVTLYEMLSGVVPYEGTTAAAILEKQNNEPPAPLSAFRKDLHPEIEPIVLSAMAIDPERRYQTIATFMEDLDLLSGGIKPAAKAEGAAAGRNVWQTAFIALVGISILAVALIYATSVKKTDPTTQLQADVGSLPVQPIGPATGAQEESLSRLPAMTDAEIMATQMAQPPGTLPGGDGYNAWANGGAPPPGAPPAGAPLPPYYPPGGQVYTIDPSTGSPFMPPEGGVILVPVPANTNTAAKPAASPRTLPANTATQPTPVPDTTPKPMATPPPKTPRPTPGAARTPAANKPADNPSSPESGP
ncbi:MAG: serine/threonine-protein kinase [Pyrinomonadaceae bacterium]